MSDHESIDGSEEKQIPQKEEGETGLKASESPKKSTLKKESEKPVVEKSEDDSDKDSKMNEDDDDDSEEEEERKVGLLDQPVEMTGQRERKRVERFVPSFTATPKKDSDTQESGSGTKLGDCPRIEHYIQKSKSEELSVLHKVLFGRVGTAKSLRKNIKNFNGFPFDESSKKYEAKKAQLEKLTLPKIKSVCHILDLERSGQKPEIVSRLMVFLLKPTASDRKMPKKKGSRRKRTENTKGKKSKKGKKMSSSEEEDNEDEESDKNSEEEVEEEEESEEEKPKKRSRVVAAKTPTKGKEKQEKNSTKKRKRVSDDDASEEEEEKNDDENLSEKDEVKPNSRTPKRKAANISSKKSKQVSSEEEEIAEEDESDKEKSKKKSNGPRKNAKKPLAKKAKKVSDNESDAQDEEQSEKEDKKEDDKKKNSIKRKEEEEDQDNSDEDVPLKSATKSPPSNDDISKLVKKILDGANLQEITMKKVIKQVCDEYPDFDLADKKEYIKTTVKSIIS